MLATQEMNFHEGGDRGNILALDAGERGSTFSCGSTPRWVFFGPGETGQPCVLVQDGPPEGNSITFKDAGERSILFDAGPRWCLSGGDRPVSNYDIGAVWVVHGGDRPAPIVLNGGDRGSSMLDSGPGWALHSGNRPTPYFHGGDRPIILDDGGERGTVLQ